LVSVFVGWRAEYDKIHIASLKYFVKTMFSCSFTSDVSCLGKRVVVGISNRDKVDIVHSGQDRQVEHRRDPA